MCNKLLIANDDLVTNEKVIFDLEKLKTTTNKINHIKCDNCKRRIRYYIEH